MSKASEMPTCAVFPRWYKHAILDVAEKSISLNFYIKLYFFNIKIDPKFMGSYYEV